MMPEMPFNNSMVMIGKEELWKFEKTDMLAASDQAVMAVEVTAEAMACVVVDLADEEDSAVVDMEAEVMAAEEVIVAVDTVEEPGEGQATMLRRKKVPQPILLPTTRPPEGKEAPSSLFGMYVFLSCYAFEIANPFSFLGLPATRILSNYLQLSAKWNEQRSSMSPTDVQVEPVLSNLTQPKTPKQPSVSPF